MYRFTLRFSAVALALVCGATALQAQKPGIGVAGGFSMPAGDLEKSTDAGYYISGLIDFSPPLAPVGFRIDGFYNNLTGSDDGADYRTYAATGAVTLGMGGVGIKPYFIGGVGLYNSKLNVSGAEGQTNFGLNGGIGAKFGLTGFSTFVEARVHYVFQKESSALGVSSGSKSATFIPVTFGIIF